MKAIYAAATSAERKRQLKACLEGADVPVGGSETGKPTRRCLFDAVNGNTITGWGYGYDKHTLTNLKNDFQHVDDVAQVVAAPNETVLRSRSARAGDRTERRMRRAKLTISKKSQATSPPPPPSAAAWLARRFVRKGGPDQG